ncbi:MAG: hypothetical protein GXZ02_11755 [Clostridiales bacterium]|nr:hypothetical protein [Clostridiales bacterium]
MLLQKNFSENHLTKVMRKNNGELPQYFVKDNHEAIVSREVFEAVQKSIQERAPKNPDAHAKRKSYPFTGKLICGNCTKHYRRRLNSGKIAWQCSTFMARGTDVCSAKQIRESVLETISSEVLGLHEFDGAVFAEHIDSIRVCNGNRLVFNFYDGRQEERVWIDPSRRDSWTEEMKAQAAISAKRRYN